MFKLFFKKKITIREQCKKGCKKKEKKNVFLDVLTVVLKSLKLSKKKNKMIY